MTTNTRYYNYASEDAMAIFNSAMADRDVIRIEIGKGLCQSILDFTEIKITDFGKFSKESVIVPFIPLRRGSTLLAIVYKEGVFRVFSFKESERHLPDFNIRGLAKYLGIFVGEPTMKVLEEIEDATACLFW